MKLLADFISRWVPGRFVPLGTEGFGISDTRTSTRRHFEIDAETIVCAALDALRRDGRIDASVQCKAMDAFDLSPDKANPMSI